MGVTVRDPHTLDLGLQASGVFGCCAGSDSPQEEGKGWGCRGSTRTRSRTACETMPSISRARSFPHAFLLGSHPPLLQRGRQRGLWLHLLQETPTAAQPSLQLTAEETRQQTLFSSPPRGRGNRFSFLWFEPKLTVKCQ